MGFFDTLKETANQAMDSMKNLGDGSIGEKIGNAKDSIMKAVDDTKNSIAAGNAEAKELKKTLEGAIARYEFTYVGGLEDIPNRKYGAWGMNIMPDRFAFRVTSATKNWLYDLDIPYDKISDIRIEKRTITTAEVFLGAGNDANQQQENVIVIEYEDKEGRKSTLRVEMITGITIYNQAAKCKELMDILRRNNILDRIKKTGDSGASESKGEDIISQIEKLSKLAEAGILSEDEFKAKKAELLGRL